MGEGYGTMMDNKGEVRKKEDKLQVAPMRKG